MTVWGIDLGVRSLYVARIDSGKLDLFCHNTLKIHKQPRYAELAILREWLGTFLPTGGWYAEEPPLAGARNLQTFLHLGQVCGVVACCVPATLVPVTSWKKGTVGNGAASKELVARWLQRRHPAFYEQCDGDQNLVDSTCIALYGKTLDKGGSGPV
jgi:Holliday junction resolvasome RuvABC endonuclease subunit